MSRAAALAFVLFAALVSLAAGQTNRAATVTWSPERPVHGTLFRIHVQPPDGGLLAVTGTVADQPLHFAPVADGSLEALAAVPLDSGESIDVPLATIRTNGTIDTMRIRVPVSAGTYPMERLTVAPRFGAPPDSATQARIANEREKALAVSRNAHFTPRLWSDVRLPRDARITSRFGSGREFNGQVQSRHTGTDLAGGVGAPVHAAARGIVALVDAFYLAGNVVYIDHGAGLVTAYFHLSEQSVAVGDTVQTGQLIGKAGATGRVTGPHLHWVVRYGTVTVDPMSLIDVAR